MRGAGPRPDLRAVGAILLTIAAVGESQERRGGSAQDVAARAASRASRLLAPFASRSHPPYTSDVEHARTVDPVLTRGAVVWIREDAVPGQKVPRSQTVVQGGRVFSYLDVRFDPTDVPRLRIRPVDDRQEIPVLVRVTATPEADLTAPAVVRVTLPYAGIFQPRLDGMAAWVGSTAAEVGVDDDPERAELTIAVELPALPVNIGRRTGQPVVVVIQGTLVLGPYPRVPVGAFDTREGAVESVGLPSLAGLVMGRDAATAEEIDAIRELARRVAGEAGSDYDKVVAVNRWLSARIRYQEVDGTRSPVEVLDDGSGDCDDFTRLMVAMLRAEGVPCRRVIGDLYDLDSLIPHAWVEVALPLKRGGVHWFACDPTLAHRAATDEARDRFVQLRGRVHLYEVQPVINLPGFIGSWSSDVFLNWREPDDEPLPTAADYDRFSSAVIDNVDRELMRQAALLDQAGLRLEREFGTIPGSRYRIAGWSLPEGASAHMRIWLENEERLVLELAARDGRGLRGDVAQEMVDRMRSVYGDLNGAFFGGVPARRSLELLYVRDPHTDALRAVTLRFGAFLVERQGRRILSRLQSAGLIPEAEHEHLKSLLEVSGGRNLYVLQELARLDEPDPTR